MGASDKIEMSPAGMRRHTPAGAQFDFAVLQCCPLEGGSITAPSSYLEMLTCCRDAVWPARRGDGGCRLRVLQAGKRTQRLLSTSLSFEYVTGRCVRDKWLTGA